MFPCSAQLARAFFINGAGCGRVQPLFMAFQLWNPTPPPHPPTPSPNPLPPSPLPSGGIIAMWLVPSEYDFGKILDTALLFYDSQR
jgi:hypothetical protein